MKNRFMNISYAIEVLNSRLNTSASQIENNIGGFDNITFTKKIDGKGYSSACQIKKNMKDYMKQQGFEIAEYEKNDKKITVQAHPSKFINEDLFGFMRADKEEITEEQYNELDDKVKKLYSKPKKGISSRNVTKKRRGNFALNGLICVNKGKVQKEWGVCATNGDSMPYILETYSDVMVGLGNLNISEVGKFNISNIQSEFRDYAEDEAEALNIQSELTKEERLNRIEVALRSLEFLSIKSNQTNYLTDTMPKITIISEYSYGNNVFQSLINKNGINIEGLKEVVNEFDDFRQSDIWIGVSDRIQNENFQGLKERLEEELKEYDFIHIGTVKNSFDEYLNYVKKTL